jgi:hypothetical protein
VKDWSRPERQWLELRRAPLMRLQVAADPHSEQWFAMLQLHHVTSDHISVDLVWSDISAHLQGDEQKLLAPIPYRNHVAEVLANARTHDSAAFFRGKLGDVTEPIAR